MAKWQNAAGTGRTGYFGRYDIRPAKGKECDGYRIFIHCRTGKKVTDQYHVPFIINDNIEVALKADADGVHVGQKDMEAGNVRELIGKDKILGVSAQTVEQALAAERSGADYLGVGAVFSTATKQDAQNVGISVLKEICRAVSIPVVAIGGINAYNIKELKGSGIAGAAVVSALFAQNDIKAAAENLSFLLREAAAQK